MTTQQKTALAQGRKRHQAEQRRASIARVQAYERWLAQGSSLKAIGRLEKIPTDSDYAVARAAGKTKRGAAR
jgi:hypothetical protein